MIFLKFNQRTRILRNPNRYVSRKVKTMSLIIFKFHAHVFSRPLANCWHNFRIFERTTFIVQFYVLLHELKVRRDLKRSRKNNTFTLRPKLQKIKQKDRVGRWNKIPIRNLGAFGLRLTVYFRGSHLNLSIIILSLLSHAQEVKIVFV